MSEASRNEVKQLVYGLTYGMGASTLAKKMGCSLEKSRGYLEGLKSRYPGLVCACSEQPPWSHHVLVFHHGPALTCSNASVETVSMPAGSMLPRCLNLSQEVLHLCVKYWCLLHRAASLQHKWTQDVVEACKASADGCVHTIGGRRRSIPRINDRDGTWSGEAERKARNTIPQGSAADIAKTAMTRLWKGIEEHLPGQANILLMVNDPCSFLWLQADPDPVHALIHNPMPLVSLIY